MLYFCYRGRRLDDLGLQQTSKGKNDMIGGTWLRFATSYKRVFLEEYGALRQA